MGQNNTRNLHWQSNPSRYMEQAKARALATLHDSAPVLTTLERSYRQMLLKNHHHS